MPGWLISILVSLALKFGIPAILVRFPRLKKWLPENWDEIIEELLKNIKGSREMENSAKELKREAVRTAKRRIRERCHGIGCDSSIKS